MCTCCTNKPSNIFNVILSIETEFMITLAGTTGNNSSAQATVSTENEIKSNPKPEKTGLIETLFKDKEKSVILALILLLSDENSDPSLLLALMYLLI